MAVILGQIVVYKDAGGVSQPGQVVAVGAADHVDIVTWAYGGYTFFYPDVAPGTGNNQWTQGPMPAGAGQTAWQMVLKTSSEGRNNSATLAADSVLKVPLGVTKYVAFRFMIWFNTPATADFKFDINGPSGVLMVRYKVWYQVPAAASPALADYDYETAYAQLKQIIGTGTDGWITIEGLISNGLTAGDLEFRWAQNTSTVGDTFVYAGSTVEYIST